VTPFIHFRLWLREAPDGERLAAGLAGLLFIALLVWALVPTGGSGAGGLVAAGAGTLTPGTSAGRSVTGAQSSGGSTAQASTQAGVGAGGTGTVNGSSGVGGVSAGAVGAGGVSTAPAGDGGAAPGGASPGGSSGSAGGPSGTAGGPSGTTSSCPTGASPSEGVTASQIHIGIALVALGGSVANSTFGVPTVQQQQQDFAAVVDAINKSGGVQCRQLVANYYQGDPLDQSNEHAVCLQAVQDHDFALLDPEALDTPTSARDCAPQNKVPLFDAAPIDDAEASQYAPYLMSTTASLDQTTKNLVYGLRQVGFFKSFKKIGVLEDDCYPDVKSSFASYMSQIGITGSEMSAADFGCPTDEPPPTNAQQAVLQFEAAGVTNVIDIGTGAPEVTNFTSFAQTQGYHPRYAMADFNWVAVTSASYEAPNATNFNGALSITPGALGAQNSGLPLGPALATCDQILTSHGLTPAEKQGQFFGGVTCNLLWTLQQAANHDPTLSRAGLRAGLDEVGSLALSFPNGPATFNASHPATGGGSWRPLDYASSCACWKVLSAAWQPDF